MLPAPRYSRLAEPLCPGRVDGSAFGAAASRVVAVARSVRRGGALAQELQSAEFGVKLVLRHLAGGGLSNGLPLSRRVPLDRLTERAGTADSRGEPTNPRHSSRVEYLADSLVADADARANLGQGPALFAERNHLPMVDHWLDGNPVRLEMQVNGAAS